MNNNFVLIGRLDISNFPNISQYKIGQSILDTNPNLKIDLQYEYKYKTTNCINIFLRFDGYEIPEFNIVIPEEYIKYYHKEENLEMFYKERK